MEFSQTPSFIRHQFYLYIAHRFFYSFIYIFAFQTYHLVSYRHNLSLKITLFEYRVSNSVIQSSTSMTRLIFPEPCFTLYLFSIESWCRNHFIATLVLLYQQYLGAMVLFSCSYKLMSNPLFCPLGFIRMDIGNSTAYEQVQR